jgi:hypothetical protein
MIIYFPNQNWDILLVSLAWFFFLQHLIPHGIYLSRKLSEHSPTYLDYGQMGKISRADAITVLWKAKVKVVEYFV